MHISRGFHGRGREQRDPARVPPGQYLTSDFPVLSAGPTPHVSLHDWTFSIRGQVDQPRGWSWAELQALPREDVTGGRAWLAYGYDGDPLDPEHGGPVRLLVPHLYFWKSAKWVRGIELRLDDEPGFWEGYGYHNYGDPWREQRYAGD